MYRMFMEVYLHDVLSIKLSSRALQGVAQIDLTL